MELVRRLTGKTPTESDRIRLEMPPVFANGYTVPLALEVDSPMTMRSCPPRARVLRHETSCRGRRLHFTPQSGRARISTRIRLAQPQDVVAVAEMSDGTFLMAKKWVEVATNGCA